MDADGWADSADNCSENPNPLQEDADFDGYGNYCDADFNNNNLVNVQDYGPLLGAYGSSYDEEHYESVVDQNANGYINGQDYPLFIQGYNRGVPGPSGLDCAGADPGEPDYPCRSRSDDADGDGVADETDTCPDTWNPNQVDVCADADADGFTDLSDNCPALWNPEQRNLDGDAEGNLCDADDDNDGLPDSVETGTGVFLDVNETGTDALNPDSDGDGIPDGVEVNQGSNPNLDEGISVPLLTPLGVAGLIALLLSGSAALLRGRARPDAPSATRADSG
ncbi:MAG: thrombospondin type 3 repeat-containing protein, partial [Myxococcota bacterium]